MKKIFSFIMSAVATLSMFAADELYVRQNSGDTRISIGSIKEITFPSGQVVVTMNDGTSKTYESSSFISLRFNGNQNVGIESISNIVDSIVFNGAIVKSPQLGILIYSTDGCLVMSSEGTEVNVSSLESGVYVVKAGCLTSKIVK